MQTLGMKAMDWRLTDWGTSPAGSDSHYTEKLYRLNCMVAYGPPVGCETLYPSPYHHHDFVTMVSLNHTRKISDQALNVWRQILVQNPNAGLIIISSFSDPEIAEKSLRPRLTNAGLPMQQVSISPKLTMRQFMSLASVADFALDSFPISGGTSTLHSLWMGLPVLALNDPQFGSRSTSSATTLKGLDLNDCVADTFDQYLNIACQWIQNPSMLDALRQRCRPALEQSPLMSHSQRVQEVESAYRHMWHQFVDKQTLVPKERTP
jgi:predicted O-linked N-acetylglucosamine transferase (SPINDLY family)